MASLSYAMSTLVQRPGNIGWVNFGTNFTLNPGESKSNLQMDFPNGSTVAFNISCTSVTNGGGSFTAATSPTNPSASFGITGYASIPGSVCLYSKGISKYNTQTKITLSNINVSDPYGSPISDYYTVLADSETTVVGESLQFTSYLNKWEQLALLPPVGGVPSTGPTISYTNQNKIVTVTGTQTAGTSSPVFITKTPSNISVLITENGTGKQGIAIGFVITSITLQKNIVGRVYSKDQFVLDINGVPGYSTVTTGNTIGLQQDFASVYLPIPPSTMTTSTLSYSVNEGLAFGSLSQPYYYNVSTTVVNKAVGGTPIVASTLPQEIIPQFGDEIVYTITNKPVYIEAVKSVNNKFSDINENLTYTVTLTNPSTATISNVLLIDKEVDGITYVGDIQVIGGSYTGDNLSSGLTISTISPGQSVTIIWDAAISSKIPSTNPVQNIATVSVPGASQLFESNTVVTQINTAILTTDKRVSQLHANIGDILTYTITTKNSGNVAANNVVMTDPLENGTVLVPGSVYSNSPYTGTDPSTGIILTNSIPPSRSASVSYKVEVVSLPSPNIIPNTATFNYNYTINPTTVDGGASVSHSNTVYTEVNTVTLTASQSVDKKLANTGEMLTYTLIFTNKGNINADNVVITDTTPNGTSFVVGSISSNITYSGTDPSTGITLTSPITPGGNLTMTYKVLVGNTIPTINPVQNMASADYTFTIDPGSPGGSSGSVTTNTVETKINAADLISPGNFVKTVDKSYVNIGDIVTYTITAKNTGNVAANNVVVIDTIPDGTTLVSGSLLVDVASDGTNPATGITLTDPIAPGVTIKIIFKVKIDKMPNPNPISNIANINYTYISDPDNPNSNSASGTTPPAITNVSMTHLISIKSANKKFADIGNIITYTLSFENIGNVSANNVVITDPIPKGTEFVPGSITSTDTYTGTDLTTGITLSSPISVGGNVVITYKLKVTSIPSTNPIPNKANASYKFTTDPNNPNSNSANAPSNIVNIQVNHADITSPGNFIKSTDNQYVDIGDAITYTITLTNTGNASANHVVIIDTLPNGVSFVPGSINSTTLYTGNDITTGISLTPSVLPGDVVIIKFDVVVVSKPDTTPLTNTSNVNYTYTVDPSNPDAGTGSGSSTDSTPQYKHGEIEAVLSANRTNTTQGDTITYTINLVNIGNVDVNDVIIKNIIPNGTDFVLSSVTIGGKPDISQNPVLGIYLGTISPKATTIVTFDVTVLPKSPNPITNQGLIDYNYIKDPILPQVVASTLTNVVNIDVTVYKTDLTLVKSSNKEHALVGDTLIYTIIVSNTTNIPLGVLPNDPIKLYDILPSNLEFVSGSVIVNKVKDASLDISKGINLGTLNADQSNTVSFEAVILSADIRPIDNSSYATYGFKLPGLPVETKTVYSNIVSVYPEIVNLDIVKVASKKSVTINEKITYTVTLTNLGTLDALNVILYDQLPELTMLICNIIKVNGIIIHGVDLSEGVNIGNISPGDAITIKYTIKVLSVQCYMKLKNSCYATFDYELIDGVSKNVKVGPTKKSITEVDINISDHKDIQINETIKMPINSPTVKSVNHISAMVDIVDSYVEPKYFINCSHKKSENEYQLVINGILNVVVEYTSCDGPCNENPDIYAERFKIPFDTCISLSKCYKPGYKIAIEGIVKNISTSIHDVKNSFVKANIVINTKITS
ncbi:MAG: hypothetical protein RSC53_03700 [Peptostreptococcaceae bacterium]